ncbi:MAG: saccharopine dehydrogenase NADP-binding domain-containing protein [Anaerolineae bacterium]|nr:saccharopine dehydrogenase NADP-binding domain-containing protein [Anaerolineae bacterium]MDH7474999.1 saccharopine dehydrogenase C-terminal domain-containing protein [Anaerolineae bacterium]
MKNILVLGAGLVAGPLVRYLMDQPDFHVTVATRTLSKAEKLVGSHPRGTAHQLDVEDEAALEALIRQTDLAISLLPYTYHPKVARLCVKHGKHMVTTSYVKDEMRALDGAAKKAGVILLNEIGVDPGIDHMTAMRVIHHVQANGGQVTAFSSYCGGLPAPEANNNPFGYKFSWSPKGVLLAGKNPARFLRDGQVINIPGEELFAHYWTVPVEVEGRVIDFEGYPNRDSLPYMEIYGITSARTMFRGTLRNVGWCATLKKIVELGLLDEEERDDIAGMTFAQFLAKLINSQGNLRQDLAAYLRIAPDSSVMSNLEWLGLLSNDPLPLQKGAPIDILTARMLEKMQYAPGERDMLILQHEFIAEYPDHRERITSTMIDFGIPYGDTSMSRTVGLPAAIGTRLILEGAISLTGVQTPVVPEIYEPVLQELEQLGISFTEQKEVLG